MSFMSFLPNAFQDMRQDVNTLIERDWQRKDFQDQREDAERAWYRNYDSQKEFAKHGIQWRVEDAQAAGLHPVFALGGGGAAFAPSVAVGGTGSVPSFGRSMASMGQNVSRSAKAGMTEEQRRLQELQELLLLGQIENAWSQADLNAARAEDIRRQPNASNGLGSADPNVAVGLPAAGRNSAAGLINVKPDSPTSYAGSDPAVTAGKRPLWSINRVHSGPGGEWVLPHADTGAESMEAIGEGIAPLWLTIRENMHRDPEFLRKNKRYIPFYDEATSSFSWLDELGRSIGRAIAGGVENVRRERSKPKPRFQTERYLWR